ncbi:MAG: Mrp/NBP35 family ATP-binding protein, partial [Myxococcota bacterium]|nr:Mrp/NBP35 family ATP-binding protein [Myxococcota bacterium]
SWKGGVGKSTVAVNLALSLKARGARVAICDVDVYGPSVPILMGVRGAKVKVDPQEKRFLPVEAYGVGVVSIAFLIEEQTPVIWRGPIVGSVVKQFLNDVQWGELDYLILDLPPGTGDVQLTLTQSASLTGAVIVTTPSVLAVADSIKGMQMFRKVEIPILGVVENMSHYACPSCGHESAPFSEGGAEEMCEQFGTKLLGRIPMDLQTQRGGDRGEPISIKAPESAPAQAFVALADQLIEKLPFQEAATAEGEDRAGLLSKLFKR